MTDRALVAETNKTWELGKLKLTLTRKSTAPGGSTKDMVTVINKDSGTRGQESSQGFMWSGPAAEFKDFVLSLGGLQKAVDDEMFGARSTEGCSCPTQHSYDCSR